MAGTRPAVLRWCESITNNAVPAVNGLSGTQRDRSRLDHPGGQEFQKRNGSRTDVGNDFGKSNIADHVCLVGCGVVDEFKVQRVL
jgi:hypothetical protein